MKDLRLNSKEIDNINKDKEVSPFLNGVSGPKSETNNNDGKGKYKYRK